MYKQVLDPVGGSLARESIFAVLPLAALFILLGGLRSSASGPRCCRCRWRSLWRSWCTRCRSGRRSTPALGGSRVRAVSDHVDRRQRDLDLQHDRVKSGHFAVLRRSFAPVSDDQRMQAVLIAFCFGALLEALAGFGTPVAITR